ncbi:MAG: HIT family protein [Candidatus Woesearchaeota archaeon]
MADCIFCGIANNTVQSFKVLQASEFVAVLDINPASRGHLMLIPKRHVARFEELNEIELKELSYLIEYLTKKMKDVLKCTGFQIYNAIGQLAGQRIDHLLIHVIPVYDKIPLVFKFNEYDVNEANEVLKKFKDLSKK